MENVTKSYRAGDRQLPVLRGVTARVPDGAFATILGPSGSGKSTLLYLLGALEEPDGGRVELDGRDLAAMPEGERDALRRDEVGFVFQAFNLLSNLSAVDNVLVPRIPQGVGESDRKRAADLLRRVGLGERLDHTPGQLSGGEQQRVAIVRALFKAPRYVFADEPTGELDSARGAEIVTLLREVQAESGATVVVVTHDRRYLNDDDLVLEMTDGVLA